MEGVGKEVLYKFLQVIFYMKSGLLNGVCHWKRVDGSPWGHTSSSLTCIRSTN